MFLTRLASPFFYSCRRFITYKNIFYVDSPQKAGNACVLLNQNRESVLDTEGVHLGRFGELTLLQCATKDFIFLCDARVPGVVSSLKPWIEGENIKVMHDSREDSSALFNQFNLKLKNVFDTQKAFMQHLKNVKREVFYVSMSALCRELNVPQVDSGLVKQQMNDDPFLWRKRPLSPHLLKYAVEDVSSLWDCYEKLSSQTYLLDFHKVVEDSRSNIDYCHLNVNTLSKPSDVLKPGLALEALLVSRVGDTLCFNLNCGRQGVVSNLLAARRFSDVAIGEVATVGVVSSSSNGRVVHLERFNEYRHSADCSTKDALKRSRGFETGRWKGMIDPLLVEELKLDVKKRGEDEEDVGFIWERDKQQTRK